MLSIHFRWMTDPNEQQLTCSLDPHRVGAIEHPQACYTVSVADRPKLCSPLLKNKCDKVRPTIRWERVTVACDPHFTDKLAA